MVFLDEKEAISFIKDNLKIKPWVVKARENNKVLDALVTGNNFNEVLINKIEKIESKDRAIARKRYSKDIRDLFHRVMQPRQNVFSASGGSVRNEISSKTNKQKFIEALSNFKAQKSLKQYLGEEYFKLSDIDPNGVIFLEYVDDKDIFPTYKSIKDIRTYKSNGQLCDVLLFEPKNIVNGNNSLIEWRLVDDATDWRFIQNGTTFTLIENKTFKHPFGKVPATILSPINELGSEVRISHLHPIVELSKDYARDKSILTIYKFQNGFPKHWKYENVCRACHGTGKTGEGQCKPCNGKGLSRRGDVTDTSILEMPRDSDSPLVAPNVEGFVSPDLKTWNQYNDDLINMESLIDATMWGTKRLTNATNETATGRFIDVQPVMNKLSMFSETVQWVDNQLSKWVENWVFGMPKQDSEYHISYGNRFIIESSDVVLNKYNEARNSGANNTILDKLLDEYLLAKYQNSVKMLENAQKKRQVEPYIHNSIEDVFDMFGQKEAFKKSLFVDFWKKADKSKDVESLSLEFEDFVNINNLNIKTNQDE